MIEKVGKSLFKVIIWMFGISFIRFLFSTIKRTTGLDFSILFRIFFLILPIIGALFFHWSIFEIITLIWAKNMGDVFLGMLRGRIIIGIFLSFWLGFIYLFSLALGFFSGYKFWFHEPSPYYGTISIFLLGFIQDFISFYQNRELSVEQETAFGIRILSFFFTVWIGSLIIFFASSLNSIFINTIWAIILVSINYLGIKTYKNSIPEKEKRMSWDEYKQRNGWK